MRSAWPSRAAVGLTSVALVLAGCSSGESVTGQQAQPATTSPSPTPTPKPPPHWPLTGLAAHKGLAKRPVLVVKVDNTGEAAPQLGLRKADMIVEELVEGGRTRLAVFLHSKLPRVIGPVRSQRTSDIGIVKPARGVLVASGAAGLVRRKVAQAKIKTLVEGARGFFRDGSRPAPYNLMTRPRSTVKVVHKHARPPRPYLQFADANSPPPTGRQVRKAVVRFSPYQTTVWKYSPKRGWRSPSSHAAAKQRFRARSVLVLRVGTRDAGYRDPAGSFVPETVLTGSGKARLLYGGQSVVGTWHKKGNRKPFKLTTAGGEPMRVPQGRTWIELVPRSGSVSVK